MTGITELWVMNEAGMCVFNYSVSGSSQSDLVGGYFSAIDMITQSKKNQSIGKIVLGKNRIIFERPKNYPAMFIGKSDTSENEKSSQETLRDIIKLFVESYPKEKVINWKGKLSDFEDFKIKIKEYFQSAEERMKKFFL